MNEELEQIKHCASCGLPIKNSKKLEKNPQLKYCSQKCQADRLDKKDKDLESYILKKLKKLRGSNICPSEVSKDYFEDKWRKYHQRVLKACRRLFLGDKILITQKKKKVDRLDFKGPIRISLS